MQRILLISLSLGLALAGWSLVGEADFYVIPTMKPNYAPVAKTGQKASAGPSDDGSLQKGVAWPISRFINNKNGTVTDRLTGLIWLENANAFGAGNWTDALSAANALHSGSITGLMDGSQMGDWRLPNLGELQSLIDRGRFDSALPEGHPFANVQYQEWYWSSTTIADDPTSAWRTYFSDGDYDGKEKVDEGGYVWCVRDGG